MTAEVAILNREAVVIAADSAVTLGSPVGKVYNSANKLFALSRVILDGTWIATPPSTS